MKAIVSYIANRMPINMVNISVVQKKEGHSGVNFKNRQELIDFINSKGTHKDAEHYLHICCQCSKDYLYDDENQLPTENLTCECGRKVIVYG